MARPSRIHLPATLYHVVSRGNKEAIFADDRDYLRFLSMLASALGRFAFRCHAYCLLWNHFHLLIEAGVHPIWRLMQQLNSRYCQSFNRVHNRVGHVVQGRYKSPLIDNDVYFLRAVRYIVRNPVAAGLVTRPEDWIWSSYRATAGLCSPAPGLDILRVLTSFNANDIDSARQQFVSYVNDNSDDALWRTLFLADATAFATRVRPALEPQRANEDFTYAERYGTRPPLWDLLPAGSDWRTIRSKVKVAFFEHAYTLREIGAHLRRPKSTIWRWVHGE
jgi:putative transposase